MTNLERNKKTVVDFYTRAFNEKQPADAAAKYIGDEYIQHNPNAADGADAFVQNISGLIARSPQLTLEIKRVVAEGNLVVAHDLVKTSPEDRGLAGVDIFRLENDKIVEHWDVRQPVPEIAANNSMF